MNWLKIALIITLLPVLTGCSSIVAYIEDMQKQSVDEYEQRSQYFKPRYQLKPPERAELSEREKALVGAPPPPQGVVLLDGTRYYSANGHVCHLIQDKRYAGAPGTGPKSACYIKGRWVLAAPVLNTTVGRPR